MADTPDPQELARRYLDLWQQHLTQAATDPDLAAAMAKFWQDLPSGMNSGIPGWPPTPSDTSVSKTGASNAGDPDDDTAGSASASGSTPDPASPDSGGDGFDKLLDRMATLEKRLDAVERKPRSSGKRAAKGSAKRKS